LIEFHAVGDERLQVDAAGLDHCRHPPQQAFSRNQSSV